MFSVLDVQILSQKVFGGHGLIADVEEPTNPASLEFDCRRQFDLLDLTEDGVLLAKNSFNNKTCRIDIGIVDLERRETNLLILENLRITLSYHNYC